MDGSIHIAAPTLIYVLMRDRAAFDKIDRPSTDYGEKPNGGGHLLVKDINGDGCMIVFQFWITQPLLSHQIEERRAAQRGPSEEYRDRLDASDLQHA